MAEELRNNENLEEQESEVLEDQNDSSNNTSESNESNNQDSGNNKEKTFTQQQVNRMMSREKAQGKNSVYKEFGIDPKDTKMVSIFKAFIASQKQSNEENESQNVNAIEEANKRVVLAEAKAEALMLGIKSQYVDDAVTLALTKVDDENDIKTVLGEFKTKYPIWFSVSDEDDKGKKGQKGTGSSIKGAEKSKEKGNSLGARLAAQRKTNNKKSSYWGNLK